MQISTSSATYGASQAQHVLASLLQPTSQSAGQEQPGKTKGAGGPPPAPPPGPPPGGGAAQFSSNTLSSLLSTQERSGDDLASKLIEDADSDGDGALSLEEIQTSLGAEASEELTAAVSELDTDGDGVLSADELSAGLEANRPERRGPPPPPSSSDIASKLLSDVDTDSDGALSLSEITSKLGVDENADLTSAFGKLDTDGDSLLSTAELTAALDAFQATRGYGETKSQSTITA